MAASLGVSRAGSVRATRRVQQRAERREQRYRQAFIEGVEEQSRRALGRPLTREELERVLRRYPGGT
jgi:DNA-binding transcriptional regulator YbjK